MQRVKETAWIAALQGRSMHEFHLLLFCGALLMQHTRTYKHHVDDVPFFFFCRDLFRSRDFFVAPAALLLWRYFFFAGTHLLPVGRFMTGSKRALLSKMDGTENDLEKPSTNFHLEPNTAVFVNR